MGNEWSSVVERGLLIGGVGEQSCLKSFAGQEVLCLTEEFKSSWRQPQEEVTSSLDQSMSHDAILFAFTDAVSENNLWASLKSADAEVEMLPFLTDTNTKRGRRLFSDQQVISVTLV